MHRVLYNEGAATVRWVPVGPQGEPVRLTGTPPATYGVVDLRESEVSDRRTIVASGTSAALDATSVQVTTAAGENTSDPRLVLLDSVTGIEEGRSYLIDDESGTTELCIVQSVSDGASPIVRLAAPLTRRFPAGSAFQGIELTATFTEATANDETRLQSGAGPFLITWDYTTSGRQFLVPQDLWLTRFSIVPPISEAYLLSMFPDIADRNRERFSLSSAISVGADESVSDLSGSQVDAAYFLSPKFKSAVAWHAASFFYTWIGEDALAERAEKKYTGKLRNMMTGLGALKTVEVDPDTATAAPGGSKRRRGFFAES